jgi:predicted nucleotide-binding protein (sugar kinase/HSP70/actin superfamily)
MVPQQSTTIGMPRGLLYHKYAPLWTHFFRMLGCRIVTSPETNRQIVENGTRYCIDETCLAVEIYVGHVHALLEKADYIFVPHIVSLYDKEAVCVKFCSMSDMLRSIFEGIQILEYTVNVPWREYALVNLFKLGLSLNLNPVKVLKAYYEASQQLHRKTQAEIKQQQQRLHAVDQSGVRVLLVAHSYITSDAMLGKNVVKLLEEQGAQVIYADVVDEKIARRLSPRLSTDVYWSYSKELLGAIEHYKGFYDGIVFLMTFPCGPDSMVIHLCQTKIDDIPICVLVLDELQSDAGLKTRLESFIDILRFKKEGSHEQAHC